ncbi:hypothetical protein F4553_000733 [Allocatelliglobosispora scoriae]|uniref:Translation initiation factor IF-2 N-terminal domain-containing protein n=1 Tax=Allocatelliglobosispora scoriae TaxID=643052 RepID=A0A841BGE7_9ACTN|nr:hypothetical protein [Allocatelliglobosispora scoriae]MBB5867354.1 hypothetical protein [Allocatelliglobosispora scoriae]
MDTIATLARDLDVTPQDVQAYVQQLVTSDGEAAVVAQPSPDPAGLGLTDEAADKVRVQLTH